MRRMWIWGILFPPVVIAQNLSLSFEQLDIRNGLSNNHVSCMIQDHLGFIWVGTDDGLNRYDGYQFKVYSHIPGDSTSLASDVITALFQDHDRILWVGTDKALHSIDLKSDRFSHFDIPNVYKIFQDDSGVMWFASFDRGVVRLLQNTRQFQSVTVEDSQDPGERWPLTILKDSSGDVWLGSFGAGLKRYDAHSNCFRPFPLNTSEQTFRQVSGIEEKSPGHLWVGCKNGGLFALDIAQRTMQAGMNGSDEELFSNLHVHALYKEENGTLWLATDGEGLFRIDSRTGAYQQFLPESPRAPGLGSRVLDTVYKDRSGTLWIGTFHEGLFKAGIEGSAFHYVGAFAELSEAHATTWTFAQDRQQNLWIGTSNGLVKWNSADNRFEQIRFAKQFGTEDGQVRAIHIDQRGIFWLGYLFHGLVRYDPETQQMQMGYKDRNDHPCPLSKHIYCIATIDDSCLWLGTNGSGLIRYQKQSKKVTCFTTPTRSQMIDTTSWVTCIQPDGGNRLWVGTWREGLRCFDTVKGKYIETDETRISANGELTVTGLRLLQDGRLAMGTYGQGLAVYDSAGRVWQWHNQAHGLPSGVIHGILQDRQGLLWLTTNRGLARLDLKTGHCKTFDSGSGSRIMAFSQAAVFQTSGGEIYTGGLHGFQYFNPSEFNNHVAPEVVLTGVKKFARYPIPVSPYALEPLRFEHFDNYVSFEFVGLHYKNSAANEYACKLDGVDRDWLLLGHRRDMHYGNLQPGSYVFRLRAANSDGFWSKELSLPITIAPPLWRTGWFRFSALLLMSAVIFLAYRNRIAHARAVERARYQERQQVQEEMVMNFHDEVGSAASIIVNYSVLLKRQLAEEINSVHQKTVEIITKKAVELNSAARQFIREYDPQNKTIGQLMDYLMSLGEEMFMANGIRLTLQIQDDSWRALELPLGWYQHLANIFKEGMHNIKRHAAECDRVMLSVSAGPPNMQLVLLNSGKSFDASQAHSGQGLRNMRLRAEKIGAKFELVSLPTQGTKLVIHLHITNRKGTGKNAQ